MRPSTILLTAFTILFGATTIVLAVSVGPRDTGSFVEVLRLGGLVTIGFGAATALTVINRRRRDRLQNESRANPGTAFINARATDSTVADLEAWSPGLEIRFPCDLGFDRAGMTSWSSRHSKKGKQIATRQEITGFDVFDERTPLGSTSRWGIAITPAPRAAGSVTVRLWSIDEQRNQDEYAMRRTISRIESALGTP
jgi:hypothetical protein